MMVPQNPPFSFDMYPHFFDGAKKRRYPSKKRFPTPAVCSRKRCPLHKGTKTLHRKNGDSDSRPPSFRPTAVFILHLPPGYFWLDLAGWDYNPSVICFANATSLCTREAFVTAGVIIITVGADIIRPFFDGTGFAPHPSKPSVLPPSPKGRLTWIPERKL